jgi:hypothetical protein
MTDHIDLDEGIEAILANEPTVDDARRALIEATAHLSLVGRAKALARFEAFLVARAAVLASLPYDSFDTQEDIDMLTRAEIAWRRRQKIA